MADNKIIIQQAYYGEVHNAHSCISQSIKDTDLTSFLIAFTDRPAALPPNIELMPYLSGVAYSQYYIFTKTFSDRFATRAGMVFTHVLILNIKDIANINSLEDILINFEGDVPEIRKSLEPLNVVLTEVIAITNTKILPRFIQETISSLLKNVSPILFSGEIEEFREVLQNIWNFPDINFRKKIKFRISFTPSDVVDAKDLTIVCIQKQFLSKWAGQTVIKSENNELVGITSYSEALFLGNKDDNPFFTFLGNLNIKESDFSNLGRCAELYEVYISSNSIEDPDILRYNIRILTKISPSPSEGNTIKGDFLKRLESIIHAGRDTNLKALRNIDWQAFNDGEIRIKQIIADFISSEFRKKQNILIEILSEILNLSIVEQKTIWHLAVQESFKKVCSSNDDDILINLWKLIDLHTETFAKIAILIPNSNESYLRNCIPVSLNSETIQYLEAFAKEKKWYLFHADILLKNLPISEVITKQLVFENKLNLSDSIGVKYLVGQLKDKDLLKITLLSCDEKLIKLMVERVLKDKTLLNGLDLTITCWQTIWAFSLEKTRNISNGIEGKEQGVINTLFDLIIFGSHFQEIIIELIANSTFNDISEYQKRAELWKKIPLKYQDKFLEPTAKSVLKQFLSGQISFDSIENEVVDKITSDSFMSIFLNSYQSDIESVLKVYEGFPNLKDGYLSDYVYYYRTFIKDAQAQSLGYLVNRKKFEKTAKTIYDKSKYNYAYKSAYEECRELVNVSWLDELFSTNTKSAKNNKNKTGKKNIDNDSMKKQTLPTVVILTAIQEEYLAVRCHLKDIQDADKKGVGYEKGIFEFNGNDIVQVIIRECGATNNISAQETEKAISNFNPNMILFVGIAGSRKPNDFKIGDVIFPLKIYCYEGGKANLDSFSARPDSVSPSFSLIEKAKKIRNSEDWKALIKGDYSGQINANTGIIASGEQLIEHHSSEVGKILTDHYNDTSVVEMEGYGFAKAATRQGIENSNMLVGVIRGISDVIEQPQQSQELIASDRRPANAKQFACDTATAFAFWLIFKTYE